VTLRRAAALVLLVCASAWAHTPAPEDVVATIAEPAARVAAGVERAERDMRNPRVLLVRVGPDWFARPRDARAAAAAEWRDAWRRAVPDGVVAVLDGASDRAVVRWGRGGTVADVRDPG
jgi:hypothetical protein